jgi:3-phytase
MQTKVLVCSSLMAVILAVAAFGQSIPDTLMVAHKASTDTVIYDADDAAIWIHPTDPSQSLIIGTDKGTYPNGGLFVWNLDGTLRQRINISHPNSVDVRYGFSLSGQLIDIAVVTMRDHEEIRAFKIDPDSLTLTDVSTKDKMRVFASPLGLALYKRPSDGAFFAFVSSASTKIDKRLWQLQLEDDGSGGVKATLVRDFWDFSTEVEGMVADDELGYVYIAEQEVGIHKYYADPDMGNEELAFFAQDDGIVGNREGLAIYTCQDSTGYLLVSNPGNKCIKVYPREGSGGDPNSHPLMTTIYNTIKKGGDGIDVTSAPVSEDFQHGFLAWHDQKAKLFRLYAWDDVAQGYLTTCVDTNMPTLINVGERKGVDGENVPDAYLLEQNYPNPFNATTRIMLHLAAECRVKLSIYDISGKEVRMLQNSRLGAGRHDFLWDGTDEAGHALPSGLYFYFMHIGGTTFARKMTLLK